MIVAALLLALYSIYKTLNSEAKPKASYDYETEFRRLDKKYEKIIKGQKDLRTQLDTTPPSTITYYKTINPQNTVIEKIPDSLLLYVRDLENKNDSLRIAISDKYLKNFPTADKLIDFKLTRDTLNINTLTISGETRSQTYPMFFDTFDYYWDDNTLHHKKTDKKPESKYDDKWKQVYLTVGLQYILYEYMAGLDYSVTFNRIKLQASINTTIQTNPNFYGDIKLGYRLFK